VSDAAWGGYTGIMIMFVVTMTMASCATVGVPMKRSAVEEGSRTEKQNRWIGEAIHSLLERNCRKHCCETRAPGYFSSECTTWVAMNMTSCW